MGNPKYAIMSLTVSLLVLLEAALTFTASYFGLSESHPLASFIFIIVLVLYLPEYPWLYVYYQLGFTSVPPTPIALPMLGIVFALLSLRKKEGRNALLVLSIGLITLSISLYLSIRLLEFSPGAPEEIAAHARAYNY